MKGRLFVVKMVDETSVKKLRELIPILEEGGLMSVDVRDINQVLEYSFGNDVYRG